MSSLSPLDWVFAVSAVLGGVLLIVRLILMLVGHHGEFNVDVHSLEHIEVIQDSGASFQIFSVQGFTAFFLMFGLIGLAVHRQYAGEQEPSWVAPVSIGAAVLAGTIAFWVMVLLMALMRKLQSSGTLNLQNSVGREGSVYLTIPAGGIGKVQVAVQEHLMIFDAIAEDKLEIKTGERVRVRKVVSGNVMVVGKD